MTAGRLSWDFPEPIPLPGAAALLTQQVLENSMALSIPRVTATGLNRQCGRNVASEAGRESLEFQGTRRSEEETQMSPGGQVFRPAPSLPLTGYSVPDHGFSQVSLKLSKL